MKSKSDNVSAFLIVLNRWFSQPLELERIESHYSRLGMPSNVGMTCWHWKCTAIASLKHLSAQTNERPCQWLVSTPNRRVEIEKRDYFFASTVLIFLVPHSDRAPSSGVPSWPIQCAPFASIGRWDRQTVANDRFLQSFHERIVFRYCRTLETFAD